MNIVLGATGHVGSAVARRLLAAGQEVTAVCRGRSRAKDLEQNGARIEEVDVFDVAALRSAFKQGNRLFLLNPPSPPVGDPVARERARFQAILEATKGSGLEYIVAQSTYGAQRGEQIGDLGVLFELEQALSQQPIPFTIVRGAYFMSNWETAASTARNLGKLQTLYPPDFVLPMVAPEDLGKIGADLLMSGSEHGQIFHGEGPSCYSIQDVAESFYHIFEREVRVETIARAQWADWLVQQGFSEQAANSFARMTAVTLDGSANSIENIVRGETTLSSYLREHCST